MSRVWGLDFALGHRRVERCLVAGWVAASLSFAVPARAAGWKPVAPMAEARLLHTATLLANGRVLVTGGFNANDAGAFNLATAELYDPASNSWTSAHELAGARTLHTATLLTSGEVVVIGGGGSEIYDPMSNAWRTG